MKKQITYILLVLLLNSCNQQANKISKEKNIQNSAEISEDYNLGGDENCEETREEIYLYLTYGASHIDDVLKKKSVGVYDNCYINSYYTRSNIVLFINELNSENILELQKSMLIQGIFDYNLDIEIKSIESDEDLYNLIKYINRNTSIPEIQINIKQTTLKIDEKLFTEILQNSRFKYGINLDFSDDFKEIDILRRMEQSNIQALGFNEYKRGMYFDDFYFRSTYNDTVRFTHKGKRAEFDIENGKEIFNYFEGPGSERIPFKYGE